MSVKQQSGESGVALLDVGGNERARVAAHVRWNFTVLGADIAFFSLGLSISSAYTVLPLFVHHLTSGNEAVALIPAVRALGMYAPPLLVAGYVERRRHAMPYILTATLLERLPFLALAIVTLWLTHANPIILLTFFLLMIFLATAGSGLTTPAWLDLVARAIPTERFGRFLGFWTGVGGVLGIGGAAIAAALIKNVRWPVSFALCFLLTFAAFVVSFVLLALGREPARVVREAADAAEAAPAREAARRQWRDIWTVLRGDRGLQRLLACNGIAGIATMASALFAVAALGQGGLSYAQVGVESTVLLAATTAGNFVWGVVGDHLGHRMVLVYGTACATAAALTALVAHGFWMYALVFLLLGLNLSSWTIASFTFIAEFGPVVRRPTYIALASVAYAPFAIGAPALGGALADGLGYSVVFVLAAVAGAVASIVYALWVPDPRTRAQPA